MNSPASILRHLGVICFSACLVATMPARAQDSASAAAPAVSDEPLVIANGKFTRDGKSVPATVKNLVELIRLRFRGANITVVDVDDVVVEHLTLHWARARRIADNGAVVFDDPPLAAILAALSMASGEKFTPVNFGPHDFVLRKWGETNRTPPPQQTEVFNLSPFIAGGSRRTANLQSQLHETELQLQIAQKRYGDKHPRIVELNNQIDGLKSALAEANQPAPDVKESARKLMDQIREVVYSTLDLQGTGEKAPEFQFHPGTNLLIVIGSENAMNVTRKVIAALEKND